MSKFYEMRIKVQLDEVTWTEMGGTGSENGEEVSVQLNSIQSEPELIKIHKKHPLDLESICTRILVYDNQQMDETNIQPKKAQDDKKKI